MEPEELIALLHDLAARIGTASDEHEYGDNKAVWFDEGKKILDYLEADDRLHRAARISYGEPGRARYSDQ